MSTPSNRSTIRNLSPVLFVTDRQRTLNYYSSLGFHCDNELTGKGARLHKTLQANAYGMKEFSIIDPDGYTIGFGESIQD